MIENFYLNRIKILQKSIRSFYQEKNQNFNFSYLKIGCELEFFLLSNNGKAIDDVDEVNSFCKLINGKREQGEGQIEIATDYTDDLIGLASEIENLKNKIINLAAKRNFKILFDSKPFYNDCGSSLQFNISLHDLNQKNIFYNNSQCIDYCANGLLDLTNSMLLIIAPKDSDYLRFNLNNNKNLFKNNKYIAPVNLSYGNDNRTCAIRICDSKINSFSKNNKRLEYRVASSNCDIWLGLSAIILALEFGLQNKRSSYQTIYGNAFDDIYDLPPIVDNIKEAERIFFDKNNYILNRIKEFLD